MINDDKWISSLPNRSLKANEESMQIDHNKWMNTIPKKNSFNSVKKYSIMTILFSHGEGGDGHSHGKSKKGSISGIVLDNESKNPTGINLNLIKGVNNDSIISEQFSGAELKLPLMVNSNQTKYILEQNEIRDTLIIFHQTKHQYLNRSCGFKSNFLIKSDTEIIKESGWIREISIVQDSIFNEEKTNIFIHY